MFKQLLFLFLLLLTQVNSQAVNYYSTANGVFTSNIWSTISHVSPGTTTPDATCPISIAGADRIYINHDITLPCNIDLVGGAELFTRNGASLTITGNGNLTGTGKITVDAGGELNVSGNLDVGGAGDMTINGTVNVGGNFYNGNNNGNVICGTGTLNIGIGSPPVGWDNDACNSIVLPIELLSFYAISKGSVVELNWTTASEINNDYFTVERSSNGVQFTDVAEVDGAGNSNVILNYQTIDNEPLPGISYYRLRQTDFDSSLTRSNTVVVDRTTVNDQQVVVYPNPLNAGGEFTLNLTGFEGGNVDVVLYDIAGRVIYSTSFLVKSSFKSLTLAPGKTLANGSYLVSVASPKQFYSKNLVVR